MKTSMHRLLLTCLFAVSVTTLHAQTSLVPSAMNYQGLLTDTNGDPVAPDSPTNQNVEFRLYKDPSGGTALWGETQTVTVFKGNFSVVLGNGTGLSGIPSGAASFVAQFTNASSPDLYFGISPQGGTEFAPRQKILSSAYAMRAKTAESVNQTSGNSIMNSVTIGSTSFVSGNSALVFGAGISGKEGSAGTIGYQTYSAGLDIVGAGTLGTNRKITLWAEGGTEFKGSIYAPFGIDHGGHGNFISSFGGGHAFGSQNFTTFARTAGSFAFYLGGAWNTNQNDPGGGTTMAVMDNNGLSLKLGKFSGDGNGLTNLNPNSLPNNYNYLALNGGSVLEFGLGVGGKQIDAGKIGYGSFSGGASLDIVGVGTGNSNRRITLFAEGGTNVTGGMTIANGISLNGGQIDYGGRTGVMLGAYGNSNTIGVQSYTLYSRCPVGGSSAQGAFAWYRGGSHSDGEQDPGGGSMLAKLQGDGLYVYGGLLTTGNNTFQGGNVFLAGNGVEGNISFVTSGWRLHAHGGGGFEFQLNGSLKSFISPIGDYVKNSDRRLKTDIKEVDHALDGVLKLKPSTYRFKDQPEGSQSSFGFVAQDVQEVFPGLVATHKSGMLAVNYEGFIPLTVGAVQEQQRQIENLNSENGALKKRLAELEAKMQRLADRLPEAPAAAAPSDKQ